VTGNLHPTFEGTEGGGNRPKSRSWPNGCAPWARRSSVTASPGGTPIGEEIRHTLQHSESNHAMTSEAELLLPERQSAQLVREVIRPAPRRGGDSAVRSLLRLHDRLSGLWPPARFGEGQKPSSTLPWSTHGPDLTLLLESATDAERGPPLSRQTKLPDVPASSQAQPKPSANPLLRDRMEEADRAFFERVQKGFHALASAEPKRIPSHRRHTKHGERQREDLGIRRAFVHWVKPPGNPNEVTSRHQLERWLILPLSSRTAPASFQRHEVERRRFQWLDGAFELLFTCKLSPLLVSFAYSKSTYALPCKHFSRGASVQGMVSAGFFRCPTRLAIMRSGCSGLAEVSRPEVKIRENSLFSCPTQPQTPNYAIDPIPERK